MTLDEFNRCAQLQADYLHSRGCYKPKEMVISASIRSRLNLGSSITLNHVGEIPLVEDASMPLFMFRGFTYDKTQDTSSTVAIKTLPSIPKESQLPDSIVIEKSLSVGMSELIRSSEEDFVPKMGNPVPTPSASRVPMSQRKRTAR